MNRHPACARDRKPRVICFLLLCLWLAGIAGCTKQPDAVPPPQVRRPVRQRFEPEINDNRTAAAAAIERDTLPAAAPESESGRGWVYRNQRVRDVPWSINLLKIDRAHRDLEFTTTLGRGTALGLGPISDQIEALPAELGQPIAAVNGDFYRTEQEPYAGDPRGLQIMRGELVSAPDKVAFWIDAEGKPFLNNVTSQFTVTWPGGETTRVGLNEERHPNDAILYTIRAGHSTRTSSGGREFTLVRSGDNPWLPLRPGQTYSAEVREVRESGNSRLSADTLVLSVGPMLLPRVPRVKSGAVVQISMRTMPDLAGVQMAVGGGPVLLRGGKVQSTYDHKGYERHPRSAVGWNDQYFFLAEVDGRQHGFSVGMTLAELANYLARQGCQEAMNLDGGGSAEMWVEGRVVNRPCFGFERNTANALVLIKRPEKKAETAAH